MLNVIDIRSKGIKAINEEIENKGIATLSYRGKPKYVILDIEEYEKYREIELILAYQKAKEEIKNQQAETVKNENDLKNHIDELKKNV